MKRQIIITAALAASLFATELFGQTKLADSKTTLFSQKEFKITPEVLARTAEAEKDGSMLIKHAPNVPAVFDGVKLARLMNPASVVITSHQMADGVLTDVGSASGFAISGRGHIVTNSHALADTHPESKPVNMVWIRGQHGVYAGYLAIVVVDDKESDLAILRIAMITPNFLRLLPVGRYPQQGEKVAVMSSPHGLAGTFSTGVIAALRPEGKKPQQLQYTAPVSPGSSGSPIVNKDGHVVGIVTSLMTMTYSQNVNMGTNVRELRQLVGKHAPELTDLIY